MNVSNILGIKVLTLDGRGSIFKRIIVRLNTISQNQVMKGVKQDEMNYSYEY